MAAQTTANGSTVTMPTALVFLVSNFSNFVTIKLDADNNMLWKNQVRNALSANGYLGFIDGTTVMPCPEILDSGQNKVPNPEYMKWTMINGHFLACITATVSPSIQTHLLGLEHVYEVLTTVSNRFSSLSRSHVHDLRQRLFHVTKTSSMQEYLDELTDYAQKLAASGSPIDEEELIFYALNGLPSEFDPIKSATRMRGGELKFEELTSILEAEDMILQKAQTKSFSKPNNTAVLVATQSSGVQGAVTTGQGNSSSSASSSTQNLGYHTAQPVQSQQPYYNSYQSNRNKGNGRGRGYRGQQGQQWNIGGPCQICFRTNHTAASCYYRQNLGYQPSVQFQGSQASPYGQIQFQSRAAFPPSGPPPNQGFLMPYGYSQPQSIGQPSYQGFPQSGGVQPYNFTQPQRFPQANFTQNMASFGPPMVQGSTSGVTPPGSSWFFDSRATSHVTNDLSNLSTQQPYTGGTGVMVGNGHTLPVAHIGSTYEPRSSQGSMSPWSLSNLSLY